MEREWMDTDIRLLFFDPYVLSVSQISYRGLNKD